MRLPFHGPFFICVLITACTPTGSTFDGEGVPSKGDSFTSPTAHLLSPNGTPSRGTLSSREQFHAFSFELTGNAYVTAEITSRDPNLDTVAYLYNADTWGRYLVKNDDIDRETNLGSRLTQHLGAGKYQLKVLGKKRAFRGTFEVTLACEGEGCAPGAGACDELGELQTSDAPCGAALSAVLSSPIQWTTDYDEVKWGDRCGLPTTVRRAYEKQFHFEDDKDGVGREEFDPEVRIFGYQHGLVTEADPETDEGAAMFVFDADGKAIAGHYYGPSPGSEYYCQLPEGLPDTAAERCLGDFIHARRGEEDGQHIEGVAGDDVSDLPATVRRALKQYGLDMSSGDAGLHYEADHWRTAWSRVADVTVSGGSTDARYFVIEDDGVTIVITRTIGGAAELLCSPERVE